MSFGGPEKRNREDEIDVAALPLAAAPVLATAARALAPRVVPVVRSLLSGARAATALATYQGTNITLEDLAQIEGRDFSNAEEARKYWQGLSENEKETIVNEITPTRLKGVEYDQHIKQAKDKNMDPCDYFNEL